MRDIAKNSAVWKNHVKTIESIHKDAYFKRYEKQREKRQAYTNGVNAPTSIIVNKNSCHYDTEFPPLR